MSGFVSTLQPLLLAVDGVTTDPRVHFDFPEGALEWSLYLVGFLLVVALSVAVYMRDVVGQSPLVGVWLGGLRLAVIASLFVIALDPHTRSSRESISPSRVVVLVDTSTSMGLAERLAEPGDSPSDRDAIRSRSEAAEALLAKTDLIEKLQRNHEVLVYTFDEKLGERLRTFPRLGETETADTESESTGEAATDTDTDAAPEVVADDDFDWSDSLEPLGGETRLADAVADVISEFSGPSFAGVIVVSDGVNNAGSDPEVARAAATKQNVRIVAIGVGDTRRQPNLRITNLQMPTNVQTNDPYEVKAYVQAQNVAATNVRVRLLGRPEGDAEIEPQLIEERDLELVGDEAAKEVVFTRSNEASGRIEYIVRVDPLQGTAEMREDDNVRSQVVEASDDPTKVFLIAGGPMRDYRFVRNALKRHAGVEVTVWLQTIDPDSIDAVSQDADNPLLTEFPKDRGIFEYDVVIAFDPDWAALTIEDRDELQEWVAREAGGLIIVAGDVHTPELTGADESFDGLREMYPVVLDLYHTDIQFDLGSADPDEIQPWAPEFTKAGSNVEFLRLAEDSADPVDVWADFEGFYRCYPTSGVKGGTVVYANFSNPKARNVLLASHYYQAGLVMYLGSPEMWRLRAIDEEYYDRFWTKAIREVGQGRATRGGSRSMLDPERDRYTLGQTVALQLRALDAQYNPVEAESFQAKVTDPRGIELVPARTIRPVPNRPGVFEGDFRATMVGKYTIAVDVSPEETVQAEVVVKRPQLESDRSEQDARLLRDLTRERDREFYVTIDAAPTAVPPMLPDRTEPIVVDERRNSLWDKSWVLYTLVALLSCEWLTRKLLKLA